MLHGLLLEIAASLVQPVGRGRAVRASQLLHETLLLALDALAGRGLLGAAGRRGKGTGEAEEQDDGPFHV